MKEHEPSDKRRSPLASMASSVLLIACFLAGCVYTYLLSSAPLLAQNLYVDEHAFVPGHAHNAWNQNDYVYLVDVDKRIKASLTNASTPLSLRDAVHQEIRALGLKMHHFSHTHGGQEIHLFSTIVRGSRSDGKESLVMLTDYNPYVDPGSVSSQASGVSILITLARRMSVAKYLHRDIIFIWIENPRGEESNQHYSQHALSAWVTRYKSRPLNNPGVESDYFQRAGGISAALCVDIPLHHRYRSFSLSSVGFYGLQPNLDLVSVAFELATYAGVPLSIHETAVGNDHFLSSLSRSHQNKYLTQNHKGLLRSAINSITGSNTAYHGSFIDFNIDAITLQSVHEPNLSPSLTRSELSKQFESCLESILRSLNNLGEKLHHSTWLYIVLSDKNFVTMSKYIYSFALLIAPMPLYGFVLIYSVFNRKPHNSSIDHQNRNRYAFTLGVVACIYFVCALFLFSPRIMINGGILDWNDNAPGRLLVICMLIGVGGSVAWAMNALGKTIQAHPVSSSVPNHMNSDCEGSCIDWHVLKSTLSFVVPVSMSPLAIINFPTAILTLLVIVPLFVPFNSLIPPIHFKHHKRYKLHSTIYYVRRSYHKFMLILCSPFTLFAIYYYFLHQTVSFSVVSLALDTLTLNLAAPPTVLYYVFFLVYLPVYITCCLLDRIQPTPSAQDADATQNGSKTQKIE